MIAYVLVKSDSYDRAEVLGVYATEDAAKRAAESTEPDRQFSWETFDGHPYASDYGFSGPLYSYSVDQFEVVDG